MFKNLTRRHFLKTSAAAAAGTIAAPYLGCGNIKVSEPMTRTLGRTGFEVTTLGLGGQASLQWTAEDVDPAAIIVKAVEAVNYLDTSNVYGPSQENFGKAFRALNLIPGQANYDEVKRRSLYLASKTMIRHAKGSHPDVRDRSQGPAGSLAVDDLRRSLSQMFGDGKGGYPEGAYIDLFQIHNLNTMAEVEAIYVGLDDPDPAAERIGALAALRDYRDGTNRTGLNPREEKLIRHIGITGHFSSPVMIECLQRDETDDLIDAMLIAINANDRRYLNHQHNAMPVAKAKNVGMIAMKVFADGAMYTKEPRWSRTPEDVVRLVGTPDLPSRPLIEYALSTPGVGTAIIGIGHIDNDDQNCQLAQNFSAAQIRPESLGEGDREEIETLGARARDGQTNWFQVENQPLGAPREAAASVENRDGKPLVQLSWQTAFAAQDPIDHYQIQRDDQPLDRVEHQPQTTRAPFTFEETVEAGKQHIYQVITVDKAGKTAASEPLEVTTA